MKYLFTFVLSLLLSTLAYAEPPSPESVDKLLTLVRTEKLLDSVLQNVEGMMKSSINRSYQGKQITPEARKTTEAFTEKVLVLIKEELSWEKMKPLYIQIYSESFTQEEIDGLLVFYASPVGQAYVEKLPAVTQKSMALTQAHMAPLMQRVQEAMRQAAAEAKAAKQQ